jgi:hypothetical protein
LKKSIKRTGFDPPPVGVVEPPPTGLVFPDEPPVEVPVSALSGVVVEVFVELPTCVFVPLLVGVVVVDGEGCV